MIAFPTGSIFAISFDHLFPTTGEGVSNGVGCRNCINDYGIRSGDAGNANRRRGMVRNVVAGLLTMIVTYFIGHLFA